MVDEPPTEDTIDAEAEAKAEAHFASLLALAPYIRFRFHPQPGTADDAMRDSDGAEGSSRSSSSSSASSAPAPAQTDVPGVDDSTMGAATEQKTEQKPARRQRGGGRKGQNKAVKAPARQGGTAVDANTTSDAGGAGRVCQDTDRGGRLTRRAEAKFESNMKDAIEASLAEQEAREAEHAERCWTSVSYEDSKKIPF
jgi:hypothetical protein